MPFAEATFTDRSTLFTKSSYWNYLQELGRIMVESKFALTSAAALPLARTPLGKARAWMRMALMERKLEHYLRALVTDEDITAYW